MKCHYYLLNSNFGPVCSRSCVQNCADLRQLGSPAHLPFQDADPKLQVVFEIR